MAKDAFLLKNCGTLPFSIYFDVNTAQKFLATCLPRISYTAMSSEDVLSDDRWSTFFSNDYGIVVESDGGEQ